MVMIDGDISNMLYIRKLKKLIKFPSRVLCQLNMIQEALGRIEGRQVLNSSADKIQETEFRVFSQWGEDGIIQFLINNIPIKNKFFVEFGVEDYLQSNTRFLLINNNWSGLVIDGSENNIEFIKNDSIYWAHNIKAECAFITKDNIDSLLNKSGAKGDIGILSVDIDGNDYWVWQAISSVSPRIVICEYNSIFGPSAQVTTKYRADFIRDKMHHSNIVYGASIAALNKIANEKGYKLVAGNRAGNNIFFVRSDLADNLKTLRVEDVYIKAQFREYKDENGKLTFDNFEQRLEKIKDVMVYDISSDKMLEIKNIKGILL